MSYNLNRVVALFFSDFLAVSVLDRKEQPMKFTPSEKVAIGFMMDLTRGRYSPCKTPQWSAFDFFDRFTASEIKMNIRQGAARKALVKLDRSFNFYYQGQLVAIVFMYGKRVGMARNWKTDQRTKWRILRIKYALKFGMNGPGKPVKWVGQDILPLPQLYICHPNQWQLTAAICLPALARLPWKNSTPDALFLFGKIEFKFSTPL